MRSEMIRYRTSRHIRVKLESCHMVRCLLLLEVGMRADGFCLRPANDLARAHRRWPTDECHDARALAREGRFEKAHGDGQGNARASLDSLVGGNWPRIALKILQNRFKSEAAI